MRGRVPVPTLAEMVESCKRNAQIAEDKMATLRRTMSGLPPGPELDAARIELARCTSDYHHWSDNLGHYRERVAKEGGSSVPKVGWVGAAVPRSTTAPLPEPDRRLPREPGWDDDEPGATP